MPDTSLLHNHSLTTSSPTADKWLVLVSDDDEMVHVVTKLVLKDLSFEGKPVELMKAKSAAETIEILQKRSDVAVLLLDVVMETMTAGLDAVSVIREGLGNHDTRIIVRTGQAGYEDDSAVIREYDVNGFTRKEELRHEDLRDVVVLGLRAFRDIQAAKASAK
ncbi:MAG: response regulator [Spirochaetota bacterium]